MKVRKTYLKADSAKFEVGPTRTPSCIGNQRLAFEDLTFAKRQAMRPLPVITAVPIPQKNMMRREMRQK